jgi:hypothetical protein
MRYGGGVVPVDIPQHPAETAWWGIEQLGEDGHWERCIADDDTQWWAIAVVADLGATAAQWGHGTYRVVWSQADRRRTYARSRTFEVGAEQPPPPPLPQQPLPQAKAEAPPAVASDPKPAQKTPPKPSNGHPAAHGLPMPQPPPAFAMHPVGQVVYLSSVLEKQHDKLHQQQMQSIAYMIESERARSREIVAAEQARSQAVMEQQARHFEQLDKVRADFMALALAGQKSATDAEQGALVAQLAALSERIDDLAEDREEDLGAQLARLSDNPTDLEKALSALQPIVGVIAQSPIGEALAERLKAAAPGGGAAGGAETEE